MYTVLGIIVILICIYFLIINLREKYLSGMQYLNVSNIIIYTWFVIYIFYEEIFSALLPIPEDARRIIQIVIIGFAIIIFCLFLIYYNKLEKEKKDRNEVWINWIRKNKEISVIKKIFFYYAVRK
jgi:uncharacterized membrane protein (DUF373 family)